MTRLSPVTTHARATLTTQKFIVLCLMFLESIFSLTPIQQADRLTKHGGDVLFFLFFYYSFTFGSRARAKARRTRITLAWSIICPVLDFPCNTFPTPDRKITTRPWLRCSSKISQVIILHFLHFLCSLSREFLSCEIFLAQFSVLFTQVFTKLFCK